MEDKKFSILEKLLVVMKWRKFILINFIFVCIISAIVSLIIPKTFTATATILPPTSDKTGFGLSKILSTLPVGGMSGLAGASEETDLFLAILNSRTVMEPIIGQFDLIKLYKEDNIESTIKVLRENTAFEVNKDGTISISANAKTGYFSKGRENNASRELARDMANAFVSELDKINKQIKTEKAKNDRIFIEKRYVQNISDMKKAEEDLRNFQEQYGVIALPEQTVVAIEAAAELKGQITVKEIEAGVLGKYVSPSHQEIMRLNSELTELRKKYNEMKTGPDADLANVQKNDKDQKLFIPFNEVPDIGIKYYRLLREVKLQENILEFLLPEYEQAKIQEAKDTPTVQILDKAVAPIKRSKPQRVLIVIVSGLSCLILSIVFIFLTEYIDQYQQENPQGKNVIKEITSIIQNDLKNFKKSFIKGNR